MKLEDMFHINNFLKKIKKKDYSILVYLFLHFFYDKKKNLKKPLK